MVEGLGVPGYLAFAGITLTFPQITFTKSRRSHRKSRRESRTCHVQQKSRYVGFRAKITVFEHFDVSGPSTVRAIAHVEAYSNSPDQGLSIGVFFFKNG